MPTPTYVALATATLTSGATSVTFSSIPATYRDLVIITNIGRNAGSAALLIRFNGDTGSNYSNVTMYGDGSSTTSNTNGITDWLPLGWNANLGTALNFVGIAHIQDYSATDKHKTVLARSNRADRGTEAIAGRWASTSAISTILVGNIADAIAGSTVSLYGIEA